MKGFDVLKVKSAVKNRNNMDLSKTHLTTMNFGQIMPLYSEETVPGDEFHVDCNYFSRMAPLAVPTYGKFQFKTVTAFVPYYMVAEDADAWLAGKTTWEGQTPHHRYITLDKLVYYLRAYNKISNNTYKSPSANSCDWQWTNANGNAVYHNFTEFGAYVLKILQSLGYTIPQNVDLQSASYWNSQLKNQKISAYPLLAFAKLYNDYMTQSQRYNSSPLSTFLNNVKFCKSTTGFNAATGEINDGGLDIIFSNIRLNYENDYFTSAWQQPNCPLNNFESITSAFVPQDGGDAAVGQALSDNVLFEEVYTQGGSDWVSIGQRAIDFLKSFDDWVRRNNYSGSRAVQQVYSRFGIKTDDYRSHYAQVISTDVSPVQVGDVTATASSSGDVLGDYAGKGIMSDGKHFDIKVSDYGLILVLGYYTVTPMNSFGFDRKVLRNEPLDYYNPEFDGIGADAISLGEYFIDPTKVMASQEDDDDVYGFTERYNAYRYGRDVITGDFRLGRLANSMASWHTGRDLSAIRNAGNMVAQSSAVNTMDTTTSEYNRIFNVTDNSVDHFYLTCQFKVDAIRPMMNLNQVPRLGQGDTAVPRNGNVIS